LTRLSSASERGYVSVPQANAVSRTPYWPVPVVRAIPAAIIGLYVTFSADHSARLGLLLVGAFALASGLLLVVFSSRLADRVVRGDFRVQGGIGALLGAAALVFNAGGIGLLLFLLPAYFAITGFLELYSGLRLRRSAGPAHDWLVVGAFTAVCALVFLLIPGSSVLAVGLFGVYAILLSVYLVIGGLSLKWGTQSRIAVREPAGEKS
jgi:uncharacterized membrane protein HdeD (DUF308 family)